MFRIAGLCFLYFSVYFIIFYMRNYFAQRATLNVPFAQFFWGDFYWKWSGNIKLEN